MASYNGLIASLTVGGSDISEDIKSLSIGSPNEMIDVSALDLSGFQRIIGRRDVQLQLTSRVSNASPGAHSVLSPATNGTVTGAVVITTTAGPVFTFTGIVANYDVGIGNDLALEGSSTIMLSSGTPGAWS